MQLKVARLKVIIALIIIITIIIIISIIIITFLRCENCMQLCRLRKDWLEVLPGLLPPSSKLPRLSTMSMKVEMGTDAKLMIHMKSWLTKGNNGPPVALTVVKGRW